MATTEQTPEKTNDNMDKAENPAPKTPENAPKTPENAPKIPKEDSFKTCRASPAIRRRLRATPARLLIQDGNKPFKESNSSHKKFNSRRKSRLNDTAGSNETFVRHEHNLLYDRDSLDPTQQISLNFIDSVTQQVITPRASSPLGKRCEPNNNTQLQEEKSESPRKKSSPRKSPVRRASPLKKQSTPRKSPVKKISPIKAPKAQQQASHVFNQPQPRPRPLMAAPKPKATPKPAPLQWNRYMSSTAKVPPTRAPSSQFKKPVMSNSSVAGSRRCLGQWNTPRITRTQSFKSTAELERDYFNSLRSSRS